MQNDNQRRREAAERRMLATMSADDIRVSERMREIRARNCSTPRDEHLKAHIAAMKRSLRTGEKKRKILFVTGESNSGKSRLVESVLAADPGFHWYDDEEGRAQPLLKDDAASPCTQRNFAIRFMKRLGLPVRDNLMKTVAWPQMVNAICAHRVMFMVIDEAQRTMKINDEQELQEFTENLITLVDNPDWPIRVILIGVDPLDTLRKRDTQMFNRSKRIKLRPISAAKASRVVTWLNEIIVEHAEFTMAGLKLEDLAMRLIHSCVGNAGSIIELIRDAVEIALWEKRTEVRPLDFAQAYYNRTECLPHDNVFVEQHWEVLPSGLAKLADNTEDETPAGVTKAKKLKPGERPR
ncbi:ATP-binding protein [Rhizobium leguminosarum]|uniref:ATP-binding protein n=1 Tax=Rhizobium leguminosarum TaxID=384 RepID=UPI0013F17531|nr:ATP-binding protein [Rhizobium leguminosarum]